MVIKKKKKTEKEYYQKEKINSKREWSPTC